jgi:DNA-binding transcriptional LysR family regulator
MLNWDDLRIFLALQRGGSLSTAARALKVNRTTVARRLRGLEHAVGTRLFEQTPEGFVLTQAGHTLLTTALRVEAELLAVSGGALRASEGVAGPVKLTASEALGSFFLAPRLVPLLERYPALELELITDRRLLDLARREAELAIRTLRATQGGLVSRRLGTMRLRLYGGHDYLERQGAPATEVELSRHTLLISGTRSQGAPEELLLERFAKKARVSLRTQGWSAQAEAAAAGLGIAALPCFIADSHPRLRRVLPELFVERELWLIVRRESRRLASVRAVGDFLVELVSRQQHLLLGEPLRQG